MTSSEKYARLAGLFLLGSLASLFMVTRFLPGFDARQEYFAGSFRMLVAQRDSFASALVMMSLTGILAVITGLKLIAAFRHVDRANSFSGTGLVGAGAGFILAGILGLPALRSLGQASEAAAGDWQVLIRATYPWASGSQIVLLFFGLGGLAVGLLIAGLSLVHAINRRIIIVGAIAPFLLFGSIAVTMTEAPLFWLAGGLPAVFWSVGLAAHLLLTGARQGVWLTFRGTKDGGIKKEWLEVRSPDVWRGFCRTTC